MPRIVSPPVPWPPDYPAPVTRRASPTRSCGRPCPRRRRASRRDWAEADRLRAEIEAAGWKIVDRGTDFALTPAAPPDVGRRRRVRYGSSANVPSRLDEPPIGLATSC